MKKTLFLSPPTFDGYDGGAGSRYQCKREVKSFWYPTWLAQLSALVPDSKLIDAPAQDLSLDDLLPMANDYEFLFVLVSMGLAALAAWLFARLSRWTILK